LKTTEYSGNTKPGEIITFGTYPQTADGTDKTLIKWRVLQNTGNELFLLSENILNCKQYHSEDVDITWNDSDLRKWLNTEFYNTAFNTAEKKLVKITHCADNGDDSPDTEDKVFLLSVSEVKALTDKHGEDSLSTKRRTIGTEFSKITNDNGCHLYVYDGKVRDDYIIEHRVAFGCSWWWLRTQGNSSSRAFFIGPRSSVRSYGRVNLSCYGVRPAFKLDLQQK